MEEQVSWLEDLLSISNVKQINKLSAELVAVIKPMFVLIPENRREEFFQRVQDVLVNLLFDGGFVDKEDTGKLIQICAILSRIEIEP
jgi:hypothetical protein